MPDETAFERPTDPPPPPTRSGPRPPMAAHWPTPPGGWPSARLADGVLSEGAASTKSDLGSSAGPASSWPGSADGPGPGPDYGAESGSGSGPGASHGAETGYGTGTDAGALAGDGTGAGGDDTVRIEPTEIGPDWTGANGTGSGRTGSNGTGSNGTGSNGTGSNGTGSNGVGPNGVSANGTGTNRTGPSGDGSNGVGAGESWTGAVGTEAAWAGPNGSNGSNGSDNSWTGSDASWSGPAASGDPESAGKFAAGPQAFGAGPGGPLGPPPIGGAVPERSRPKHLPLILSVIAGLVMIGLLTGVAFASIAAVHRYRQDRKLATVGMQQPVRDGAFQFTADNVQCGVDEIGPPDDYQSPTGQFCVVTLTIKNVGTNPAIFADAIQKAYGPNGVSFGSDSEAAFYANPDPNVFFNDVNPGNKIKALVVYDIPPSERILRLEVHENPNTRGAIIKMG